MPGDNKRKNYYEVLGIPRSATAAEIKQAYYDLAKQYHPDTDAGDGEAMRQINAAYEVLGDRQRRAAYDAELTPPAPSRDSPEPRKRERTLTDEALAQLKWVKQVYQPVNRFLSAAGRSLNRQLHALAADPFDEELMADFCDYVQNCRHHYAQARQAFEGLRSPRSLSQVASLLYYSLNHAEDALEELAAFPLNYRDGHLHTAQELFRRIEELRLEAATALEHKQVRY
ncbi:MAG: DnaJ domain-containing protein [Thermostichales cyanobacterium BF4_bins_65]